LSLIFAVLHILSIGVLARLSSWHAVLVPRGSAPRPEFREIYSDLPHWMQDSNLLLTVLLSGRVAATLAAGIFAVLIAQGFETPVSYVVGLVLVLWIPVLGEIVPRARFRRVETDTVEKAVRGLDRAYRYFLRYLRFVVVVPSDFVIRFLGGDPLGDGPFGDTESDRVLERIDESGEALPPAEQRMIRDIFDLSETRIREVMSPRTSIECVDINAGLSEVLDKINACFHSRLPVYDEDLDHIVGILVVKDLFAVWKALRENGETKFRLADHISPPYYSPETKKVSELFDEMRRNKAHMVIVVDEYGGTSGLVALEDLLEEFVGEIQDEHDQEKPPYERRSEGVYLVEGNMRIDDLEEDLGIKLPEDEEYDTISGFVSSWLGRVPEVGESLEYGGVRITVEEADEKKIDRVKIEVLPGHKAEENG
jgi:putative hemolysin